MRIYHYLFPDDIFFFFNGYLASFSFSKKNPKGSEASFIVIWTPNDILLHFIILIAEVYGLDYQSAHRIIPQSVSQVYPKISQFFSSGHVWAEGFFFF